MKFSTAFTVALAGVSSANAALRGVLPAHMKELLQDKYATQSNRGVAITSDSFEDQLADATLLKSAKTDELAFYDEGAASNDEDSEDFFEMEPSNSWHDDEYDEDKNEMGLKSFDEDESGDEDELVAVLNDHSRINDSNDSSHMSLTGMGRQVYVDVVFPKGTTLNIVDKWAIKAKQVCQVQDDDEDNTKVMINNFAPDGIDRQESIYCKFHAVFPGHSDGCDCTLDLKYDYPDWDKGLRYLLDVFGCDCFHVIGIKGSGSAIPHGRDVWPCAFSPHHKDDGCRFAPQMKVIVAAN